MMKLFSNKSFEEYKRLVKENLEYYNTLNQEEIEAITYYKESGYLHINELLLKGHIQSYALKDYDYIVKNINILAEVIYNAPKTMNDIIAYRGMKNFINANNIYGDNKYISKTFTSVTIVKDVAINFAGTVCCLFKVIIPKGTPVLLPLITPEIDYEGELILLPFCDFQIENKLEKIKAKNKITLYNPGKKIQQLQKMTYEEMKNLLQINLHKDSYITEYTLKLLEIPTFKKLNKNIKSAVNMNNILVLSNFNEVVKDSVNSELINATIKTNDKNIILNSVVKNINSRVNSRVKTNDKTRLNSRIKTNDKTRLKSRVKTNDKTRLNSRVKSINTNGLRNVKTRLNSRQTLMVV
jgi:hypothetical protein